MSIWALDFLAGSVSTAMYSLKAVIPAVACVAIYLTDEESHRFGVREHGGVLVAVVACQFGRLGRDGLRFDQRARLSSKPPRRL